MQIKYLNVSWQAYPLAVEIIAELPQHWHIRSLEGECVFDKKIHKRQAPLFDTFDDAVQRLKMQGRGECDN